MATTTSESDRIFNRLDEIFHGSSSSLATYDDSLAGDSHQDAASASQIEQAKAISANTSDKGYRRLMAHDNVTSYSKLGLLHACPRKYELELLKAAVPKSAAFETATEVNLDFAFGHAVGSGIQTYAATGNLVAAQLAAWMAWKAPYDAEAFDKRGTSKGKTLTWALYAVEKFAFFYQNELSDWEVLTLPTGKAAVELAFAVDTQNGYFHFGHIDTVLRSRTTGRLAVWEGKTTGVETVAEASYGNSYQALGYSVVVDAIANQLGFDTPDYEVLYIVYSSKTREYQLLPFTKSKTQRAEWLQDLLLDHATIGQYKELGFFPKRGDQCVNKFGRQCEWYGTCQMRNTSLFPGVEVPKLTNAHKLETVDFSFTLEDLVAAQKSRG